MTQETKPSAITIDGNDYALDDLSANARSQIVNLRVTDQEIARLQSIKRTPTLIGSEPPLHIQD